MGLLAAGAQGQVFADRVAGYAPAPGQFVADARFNDPARALGPPVGGGVLAADNTSVVSLGGVGGALTLAMPRTVLDDPRHPLGLDAIVFGNAVFVGGDPSRRFAEAGLIEISADANGNGLADDAFYPVAGSLGIVVPLPSTANGPVIDSGPAAVRELLVGYADCAPVLALPAGERAERFYTVADDPARVGIDPGSGGGDAFDIAWALNPATGQPAGLAGFDFIRITSAVDAFSALFGEVSTEVDAVAGVGVPCLADVNADGAVSPADFSAWVAAFNAGSIAADQNGDGAVTATDFSAWVSNFNAECP
jgi:hypothetical protein